MHEVAQLRVPPHSIEAERSVIGGLLLDNSAFDSVGDTVREADFYAHQHRLIYGACVGLILAGKPADIVTVFDHLEGLGKAEEVGGLQYLNALSQFVPSVANLRRYAEIVAEKALLRKLASAADEVSALAFQDSELSVVSRLDKAQELLQSVQIGVGRKMPTPVGDSVVALIDRIQHRHDGTWSKGIPTGIGEIDRLLGGGLKGGKQIIIAARPSVGKSSFAQQICINVALAGYGAGFLSQEMSKDELLDRGAANLGRIDLDGIISGDMQGDDWTRLTEAVEKMRDLPLYLDDQPALTLHDITAKARMLKRQYDLKVLVLDYLQLCAPGSDRDSRHHQIEALSRGLKNLAKQLDIAVITLSQLNRDVEKRAGGKPILSDLKESGAIEEDADVVMLLSRLGDDNGGFRTINCDIPKNRQGKVGGLCLGFNGRHQEWHAVARPIEFKTPARVHYTEEV